MHGITHLQPPDNDDIILYRRIPGHIIVGECPCHSAGHELLPLLVRHNDSELRDHDSKL